MKITKITIVYFSLIFVFVTSCDNKCKNGDCRINCSNIEVKIRFVDSIINQDITNDSGYSIILPGGENYRIYDKDSFQYKVISNQMNSTLQNLTVTKQSFNIYSIQNISLDINDMAKIYYYYDYKLFDSIQLFTIQGQLQFDNHSNLLSIIQHYDECNKLFSLKR
jgi:hypothetical protein